MTILTYGSVVGMQVLGGHELVDEGRLADAGGTQHDDAVGRRDAGTGGARRLPGGGQGGGRRAGVRSRHRAARRQVLRAGTQGRGQREECGNGEDLGIIM